MTMIYENEKPAQSGRKFIFSCIEISEVSIPRDKHSVADQMHWVNYSFTLLAKSLCYLVAASNRFIKFTKVFAWQNI